MPRAMQRSRASLLVRPSSLASSWTRTFFATDAINLSSCSSRRHRASPRRPTILPCSRGGPTNESRTAATRRSAPPDARRALRSASRFTARSRHETDPAQSQAPRPGAVRLTRMPPSAPVPTAPAPIGALAGRSRRRSGPARRPRSGVAGRLLDARGGLVARLVLGLVVCSSASPAPSAASASAASWIGSRSASMATSSASASSAASSVAPAASSGGRRPSAAASTSPSAGSASPAAHSWALTTVPSAACHSSSPDCGLGTHSPSAYSTPSSRS